MSGVMKMDPEVKTKWVAALRSGKYEQGEGRLKSEDGKFCCLGVLCDISEIGTWERHSNGFSYLGSTTALPYEVSRRWAKTEYMDPIIVIEEQEYSLATLNDRGLVGKAPFTFTEIADLIEEQL